MSTLKHEEANIGDILWVPEDGSTLPKHEESIYRDQKVIQLRISKHVVVDRDEDWSDIYFKSPQKVEEPKILKNKDRPTNKDFQGGKVNPSGFKLDGARALIQVNGNNYLRFLDFIIRSVGVIFEFLFIIFLHILGIKKARKTRRKKRVIAGTSSKRRTKLAVKKYSANKEKTASSEHRATALNWKKVNTEFVPSSNLYCYWCTKKLGLKPWELGGHFYCDSCHSSKNVNLQ